MTGLLEGAGQAMGRFQALAYAAFGRHANARRHARDEGRFRALHPQVSFETYVVGLYTVAWLVALAALALGTALLAPRVVGTEPIRVRVPGLASAGVPLGPPVQTGLVGLLAALLGFMGTQLLASLALRILVARRRRAIERTLPGAVRYLHVVAAGTTDPRSLFETVVEKRRIHGATADSFAAILRHATIQGSVDDGIRRVARDTPSTDALAPFLRSFRQRARDGPDELRAFLRLESRLLATADERAHRREARYRSRVVALFVALALLPVVLLGAWLVTAPTFPLPVSRGSIPTFPAPTNLLAPVGIGIILVIGGIAAMLAHLLRPIGHRWAAASRSTRVRDVVRTSPRNPANALVVLGPVALAGSLLLWARGWTVSHALVVGYLVVAIPVGLVDARRTRRRAAMDRRLPAFVHAVAERMDGGRPFRHAVEGVARETDLGPLDSPVDALAFDLQVGGHDGPVRKRALERFIGRIGTPLAGRTIGLAVGALEAGADTRSAISTVQTETGRLLHGESARRSRAPLVIGVGWTVALLIVAIVVAVNLMVLESASGPTTGPVSGVVLEASARRPAAPRPLFYWLTQASMLAAGWFAGVAGRGVYEALLHSGGLVAITFIVFRLTGLI